MLMRSVSIPPGSQSERDFWRTVEKNRAEDLNHIHANQKIPQASVSTSLGWRLDHGGGPFENAVSRALDSASLLRFGGPVDLFLLLPSWLLSSWAAHHQRIAPSRRATRNSQV